MSQPTVKPIPEGVHTLTPHLVCDGAAAAIEFYKNAFGATEITRLPGPGVKLMHAALRVGDSTLMLVDEAPEWKVVRPENAEGLPVTLHLYVPDVDAAIERAVDAGATLKMAATDMFWGDRYGQVDDPFGHHWSIATHTRDLTDAQIQQEMAKMGGCDAP